MTGISQQRLKILQAVLPNPVSLEGGGTALAAGTRTFPVRQGVVRVREDDGYNASFALQWNKFRTNQLDQVNGTSLTLKRFAETDWELKAMAGELVLEAGCGAGRFTRLIGETGARLVSFDFSSAVDASAENNAQLENVAFLQCDIFDMPFEKEKFDRVFCHGVLQHTPDPEGAFHELAKMLRPGGRISVDVYLKDRTIQTWKSKYIWRPITTRMDKEKLLRFLEKFIPLWLPVDTVIKRIPIVGRYLGAIVPCWNYFYTDLSREQKVQWAIMDTFDALSPAFDKPASVRDVKRWFREAGLNEVIVRKGGNGVVGNGSRPGKR